MKKIGALGIVSTLVGALMFVGVSSASAHTPAVSATCDGVTVTANSYEAKDTNTLSVSVSGGGSDSKTFSTSGSATASVPQDGLTHTYTAYVHTSNSNASYSHDYSGTVGPCGTPTKPADKVEHRDLASDPNCTTHKVTTQHQSRTVPFVLVNNAWVAGTPTEWSTDSSSTTTTTHEQCPTGTQPPAEKQTRDVVGDPNCTTHTIATQHQSRTRTYSFDDGSWTWVAGDWSAWATDSTSSAGTTQQQCDTGTQPPADTGTRDVVGEPNCTNFTVTTQHQSHSRTYSFNETSWTWVPGAWTPWVTTSSTDTEATLEQCPPPTQPDGIVSTTHHNDQNCGDDFETTTTTTTTTAYVLNEATRTWSLGVPVVVKTSAKTPVEAVDCATNVNHVKHVADTGVLPNTGAPSWMLALAGMLFLLFGLGIIGSQRRTVAVSNGSPIATEARRESGKAPRQHAGAGNRIVRGILPVLRRRHRDGSARDRADT